jgi:predicted MFS family arabinose efflux permease
MATAVLYVMTGVLPLYLTSSQIISLNEDLGFSAARLGLATSTYFGVGALISPFAGRLVQRRGATFGLRAGSLFVAAACILSAAAGQWWVLPIATALSGISNSFMQVGSNIVLVRVAAFERQGVSFGAKQGAIPLASMLAGVLLPVIGVAVGWRVTFLMAAVLALATFAIAPPVPDAPAVVRPPGIPKGKAPDAPRGRVPRPLLFLAIGGACGGAAGNAVSLFVVPSAVHEGVSEAVAGTILAVCSALVVGIRIGSGWLADRSRSSGHREMAWLLGLGVVGCSALALVSGVPLYLVAMPLAMMGSWGWPGLVYFTVTSTNADNPARASGVVLGGNLTGTLLGPLVVSQLAEREMYPAAWAFCAVISACAMTAMILSNRAWKKVGAVTA